MKTLFYISSLVCCFLFILSCNKQEPRLSTLDQSNYSESAKSSSNTASFQFQIGNPEIFISRAPLSYKDGQRSFQLTFELQADGTTMQVTQEEIEATPDHRAQSIFLVDGDYTFDDYQTTLTNTNAAQFVPFDGAPIRPLTAGGYTRYRCDCDGGSGECKVTVSYSNGQIVHTCQNISCAAGSITGASCKPVVINNDIHRGAVVLVNDNFNLTTIIK